MIVPLVALAAIGCHGSADAPYGKYADEPSPYVPNGASGNAFDAYVLAAGEAQAAIASTGVNPLGRSFFTPKQREKIVQALQPALRRVASATGSCEFHYVPAKPGATTPYRAEWRLLGHALRWQIDDELAMPTSDAALATTAVAMRFAGDLCGGGPADRTLGVEIANDVREALIPALSKLSAADLHRLADAVKQGLLRRPPLAKSFDNGQVDMALALQTLQDEFQKNDYSAIKTSMGREFHDLESSLEEFRKNGRKRAAFFDSLNVDLKNLSDIWRSASVLPTSERSELLRFKLKGDKARRAFDRHFFLIGRPLLQIEDRSLAQLRLLILEAELRRSAKLTGQSPANLAKVSKPWATDPYNGRTFGYQPDGAEFRVYSVGTNLKDDLGDTDDAGLEPDIRTVLPG